MTALLAILLALTLAPPAVLLALAGTLAVRYHARVTILAAAVMSSAAAGALFLAGTIEAGGDGLHVVLIDGPGRGSLLELGLVSLPLLPVVSLAWLGGLAVAPARTFTAGPACRSTISFICAVLAFCTTSPQWLAALLIAGSAVFLVEQRSVPFGARLAAIYLGGSAALLFAGVVLLPVGGFETAAAWLLLIGLLIRKGIVPLHSWMPDSFEHGHLIPALLFHGPQVGTYAVVVVVLHDVPSGALEFTVYLAIATTLYTAILAVAETDARRAFGYLFTGQSALVLAGAASGNTEGLAGALALWAASTVGMTGLGLAIAALELRRGRLSLAERHGGYEQMSLLATSFLVLGLATVGFPGTFGFLGEELLVGGTIEHFPLVAYVAIAATALNGITVLRMYFSLFCGRPAGRLPLFLRRRETAVFAGFAAILIVGGIFPRGLINSRLDAAESALPHVRELDAQRK